MMTYHVTCPRDDKQKEEDATYRDVNPNGWDASDEGDGGRIWRACLLACHFNGYNSFLDAR